MSNKITLKNNELVHLIDSTEKMSFNFKNGGTASSVGGETISNNFCDSKFNIFSIIFKSDGRYCSCWFNDTGWCNRSSNWSKIRN